MIRYQIIDFQTFEMVTYLFMGRCIITCTQIQPLDGTVKLYQYLLVRINVFVVF